MFFIAAVDENWGIGYKGKLLARISEDQKSFRRITTGHVVVLGRKTLEEFPGGKPLKNRTNIILSSNRDYLVDGAIIVHSLDELKTKLKCYDTDDIFIIGGQSVYDVMAGYCSHAYITKIHHAYEADAHIINLDEADGWKVSERLAAGEDHGIEYEILLYENDNPGNFC